MFVKERTYTVETTPSPKMPVATRITTFPLVSEIQKLKPSESRRCHPKRVLVHIPTWKKKNKNHPVAGTPLKINMEHYHGCLVQIIFLSKWAICIGSMSIFWGVIFDSNQPPFPRPSFHTHQQPVTLPVEAKETHQAEWQEDQGRPELIRLRGKKTRHHKWWWSLISDIHVFVVESCFMKSFIFADVFHQHPNKKWRVFVEIQK